ncbi:MAG: hypothetical protein M3R36_01680 [Bacteroidota bacterium]|nr:hypothetical protein [Bacteroidota bacterium]
MRKPTDDLFRLIKSMTGPEKGYFKKMAEKSRKNDDNKYLKLFNVIDSVTGNKNYDESKIREQFKGDILLNNLHVAKNYLYKIILKSLVQFHSENSSSIKITDLYNRALILYKKGLYKESQIELTKCKNFIYKNSADEYLFPVLKLERFMIFSIFDSDRSDEFLKNSNEQILAIEKMSNVIKYTGLFGKMLHYNKGNPIMREKEKTDMFEEIFKNSYLENEESALTTESKILFNKIYYNYYLALSDDKQLFYYSKKMISIIESNALHKNEFLHEYISILSGYLNSITFLKNYKEADDAIRKLKSIIVTSPYIDHLICITIYNFELIRFIQTGDFKEGIKLIPDIEKTIDEIEERKKMLRYKFSYSIAYLYFGAGKYEKTIEWLNKIFNENTTDMRQDILSFAHILNLISHFELDNREYLFYTIKNTFRFLYKRNKLYKVENAVMNFLRKTPNIISAKELIPHFAELKDNLIKITEDPYEMIAMDYFDFISWLESKIKGKEFAEIVKSKAN